MTIPLSDRVGFRMDLNATQMFVAVAQAGSLSAAATRLGIPLPTLSRRIRDLERQLKVQLRFMGKAITDGVSPRRVEMDGLAHDLR
jgi:molybdenum-dependent DNA-binding transcriptional regulator ModE